MRMRRVFSVQEEQVDNLTKAGKHCSPSTPRKAGKHQDLERAAQEEFLFSEH